MGISVEGVAKLVPPGIQVLDETRVGAQRHFVPVHQPLGLEAEVSIGLAEDDEEGDLRQDPAVTRGTLGGVEKDVVFLDGLQFGGHGRAAVSYTKMVIQDV